MYTTHKKKIILDTHGTSYYGVLQLTWSTSKCGLQDGCPDR